MKQFTIYSQILYSDLWASDSSSSEHVPLPRTLHILHENVAHISEFILFPTLETAEH